MKLYESWKESYENLDNAGYESFWREYLPKEMENYKYILSHMDETVSGKLSDIADKFSMDPVTFAGFLDGINDSLKEGIDLETLTEDSDIALPVDFEKLYYNMLDAKADWLYNLDEWNGVLPADKRKQIKKEYDKTKTVVKEQEPGRNEPCPCGSGKKYKKCCGANK
ncbi:MAG: SEC-C domain-containing protein [Peptoclostridium sp.]|uniref:SEC-C metal-binding domain-containing protein n=1 Tax=Peptoclostridium sp. TaxID=1904860 RepID=UPI00139E34FA|nr:SEC-C metal-binding domain-containing protein [Peptoclostridium sp.]MZQ75861.1 SEC-C domain-containing protein [Peptoclostridium sp.]